VWALEDAGGLEGVVRPLVVGDLLEGSPHRGGGGGPAASSGSRVWGAAARGGGRSSAPGAGEQARRRRRRRGAREFGGKFGRPERVGGMERRRGERQLPFGKTGRFVKFCRFP
jgi:hypothetical protein